MSNDNKQDLIYHSISDYIQTRQEWEEEAPQWVELNDSDIEDGENMTPEERVDHALEEPINEFTDKSVLCYVDEDFPPDAFIRILRKQGFKDFKIRKLFKKIYPKNIKFKDHAD